MREVQVGSEEEQGVQVVEEVEGDRINPLEVVSQFLSLPNFLRMTLPQPEKNCAEVRRRSSSESSQE